MATNDSEGAKEAYSLAERLAVSPTSPADWTRDAASLDDEPVGRELL